MPIDFQGKGRPLSQAGFDTAIAKLQVAPPALWSLITVETRGFGYLPDRRPKILFERHIFHRRTNGAFDAVAPDISSPDTGGYIGNEAEYNRLARAMAPNRKAALVRAAQARLTYLGFDPRGVDGVLGNGTRRALRAFQTDQDLPVTGEPDAVTIARLAQLAAA